MSQNLPAHQQPRIVWLDILRLCAIFMVICIHCSDPFNVSPEARSNPEFNFWGSIYGSFLRPCVPLFVMITGVLLLPIKMSFENFYKKRLLRIATPFIIWSVLYNLFPWFTGLLNLPQTILSDVFAYAPADASQSFSEAVKNILLIPFQFNVYTVPMWYLYMLIGLYLYMPVFSAWIENATIKQKKIFLGFWFLTLFLPYANSFYSSNLLGVSAWNTFDTLYYFAGFNGYLLLGHFIIHNVKIWSWNKTLAVCLPAFALGYIVTYIGFKTMTTNPNCSEAEMELFFLYCSPNVALMTTALFLLIRKINIASNRIIRMLKNITQCGLGIYMIHYFVVGFCYAIADTLAIPISLRIPVTAIIAFTICWGFVALCYKLTPQYSKWIFG